MADKLWIWIVPLIFSFIYWVLSLFKGILYDKFIFKFIRYEKKIFRRLYYLFSLTWSFIFLYGFRNEILNLNLAGPNMGNHWNFICVSLIILIFIVVWDFLFISCKGINAIIYKDVKISAEEAEDIKITEIIEDKNFKTLDNILNAQDLLVREMEEYVDYYIENDFDENTMYKDLVKKYEKTRKDIKISMYKADMEGYKEMQKDLKLDDAKLSSILYSLQYNRVCFPEDSDKDIIYAIISTCGNGDYIFVLESDFLYKNEFIVIQNIIHIFDLCYELEYRRANDLSDV
ncbi:hypothetical protein [Acetivibrio clariflavus]|uniref:Toxin SpoIISA, type II toxin-antitoxin system n=1 Tax=Acetivibrio clariflavus (strain DSM 19732 / NBRC 101661 / EBR45) TaxID=720554 RepID=G8LSI0_ACECE|nr:hypothetical protein [Acetivibrio clariflavus]AEV68284.1 hypothetical protein Clocl_1661 [Acetivibrio clariflavus DSM 19732]